MSKYSIEIIPTNNESIRKFEANSFLIQGEGHEFKNIDDAENSPIAQQLFYLPFVKTVYIAQNFIAIEKFNIVEWSEIENELAAQINDYLNSGKEVIKSSSQNKKNIPVTVYAESTPNPKVMKFVANKKLVIQTTEFKNIDEAKNSPLAQKLFHFPFVKEIFFDENYVSITKFDIAEWEEITMELREFIRNYIQEGNEVITQEAASNKKEEVKEDKATSTESLDETSKQIIAILDEYIKPAVASDGGNIMFNSYDPETKKVSVVLQGACSGCPSSTFTLKNGIENMLKEMLQDKVSSVEALNG
ncbi:Fe-S cluster biogenesis protein NfuA, 4Fe-4S-binding domain [Mesonia phycicola]|uniref:Fe-S cluster biogenesis protein NfuA, 4Fe-4S-binding domain n=1 Tax=Mesonia phycicola TaxID=579105 RepID=A0A1M6EWF7_9FLAO|nr:NifU family protein [Mesonia phycicola]SHI89794.1 Fe-S cluster biogenesis protein NfuA, 4Fe-4S-binding domain [Mesonia phycicola]